MAAIAKLQAVLGMDSREFKAGIGTAGKDANEFQKQIKKVGGVLAAAFSVGAIINMGKSLKSWANEISLAADNVGVLTSEMMGLNQIAILNGLGVSNMQEILGKLAVKLDEAADGNKTAQDAFAKLNLSIEELAGLDPAAALKRVAEEATKASDPVSALAGLFELGLGAKAVTAMRDLAENGLPNVAQSAADTADEVRRLGDEWDAMIEKAKRATLGGASQVSEFVQVAIVRGKAENKAFKESSFWEKMGFEGTRKSMAAGEAAVQEWYANKYKADNERRAEKEEERISQQEAKRKDIIDRLEASKLNLPSGANTQTERDAEKQRKQQQKDYFASVDRASDRIIADADRSDKIESIKAGGRDKESALREQLLETITHASGDKLTRDNLARLGGFFGGDRAGYDIQTKQLEVQRLTAEAAKETARNTSEMNEKLALIGGER